MVTSVASSALYNKILFVEQGVVAAAVHHYYALLIRSDTQNATHQIQSCGLLGLMCREGNAERQDSQQ